jgi:hypothetical protein
MFSNPAPPMQPLYNPPPVHTFDYSAMFNSAPSNVSNSQPPDWVVDSGASTHVTNSHGNLSWFHSPSSINSRSIVVGNGSTMPIYSVGSTTLTNRPFHLNNVLVSPAAIKSLISVRKFTRDNQCSIEFDPYGFSVKDLAQRGLYFFAPVAAVSSTRSSAINTSPLQLCPSPPLATSGIDALDTPVLKVSPRFPKISLKLVINLVVNLLFVKPVN